MRTQARARRRKKIRATLVFLIIFALGVFAGVNIYTALSTPAGNGETSNNSSNVIYPYPPGGVTTYPPDTGYNANNSGDELTLTKPSYMSGGGRHELPVNGASGFAAIPLQVWAEPTTSSAIVLSLDAGQGFTIISESGSWWNVAVENNTGWVMHRYCFINLPDVVPSIVFNITNAYSSVMRASSFDIPNITGHTLYQAHGFNERLAKDEFIVPVLYLMAPRIASAQQYALADGNTLIVYEAFRPMSVQQRVVNQMFRLMEDNPVVEEGVTTEPWNLAWFINTGISNHQRGVAIDVSLGQVVAAKTVSTGGHEFLRITEYIEFEMQTEMHELSMASAIFTSPVSVNSTTAWRDAELTANVTYGTLLLKEYCTRAGLLPLASEWWHFNYLPGVRATEAFGVTGNFYIERIYSIPPQF